MKIRYENRGFISAAISAAIVMLGIVAMFALTDVGTRFKVAGSSKEKANDTAQLALDELMNLPWSHTDVAVTEAPHVRGGLSWVVTSEAARLKKITLTATIQNPGNNVVNTLTVTGYKYDDLQP